MEIQVIFARCFWFNTSKVGTVETSADTGFIWGKNHAQARSQGRGKVSHPCCLSGTSFSYFLDFSLEHFKQGGRERERERKEMTVGKRVTLFKKKPLEIILYCFSSIVYVGSQKINTIHSQGRELPNSINLKESWWKGAHLRRCLPHALCGCIEGISLSLPFGHLGHVNRLSTRKMWLNSETLSLVCE